MNRLDIQTRIKALREELEERYKTGTIKLAKNDGSPVPTEDLQSEMYSLIYRLSRLDRA